MAKRQEQEEMSEELEELIRLLREASLDEKQAQKRLNITEGLGFQAPETFAPLDHGKALKTDLMEFYNFLAAVEYCDLRYVHGVATKMISHAQFLNESIAEKKYPLPTSLRARDVAAISCDMVKDVYRSVDLCRQAQRIQRRKAEEEIKVANMEGDVMDDSQDPDWSSEEVCLHPFVITSDAELGVDHLLTYSLLN